MSENRCVCCGEIIPEGWQVCNVCKNKIDRDFNRHCIGNTCSECGYFSGELSCEEQFYTKYLESKGCRKVGQDEIIKEFVKRFEYYIGNCTFTVGQVNDIQYALKKATEEMEGKYYGKAN